MYKILASVAIFSYLAATLDPVITEPFQRVVADLFFLSVLPFLGFQLSFEVIATITAIAIYFAIRKINHLVEINYHLPELGLDKEETA